MKSSSEKITDCIIVDYATPEYTQQCIHSVLINTDAPYHLTVYDNYFFDDNLSVVWNRLIERSDADYICLLNSDTEVEPKWLTDLLDCFDENTGIVGPVTNKCGYPIQIRNEASDAVSTYITDHLSGFCMVFPKAVWQEVGGFNEEYELYGEDDEFCRDVRNAGYDLKVAEHVYVHHYKSKSKKVAEERGKDIEKIREESAKLYRS